MPHPATMPSAAAAFPKAIALAHAARSAWRVDRANAYGLLEDWTLPRLGGDLPGLGLMPPDYESEAFSIRGGVITVKAFPLSGENCDGCTLSPDTWGDLKTYLGALFHDRWYADMEGMARAWGWEEKKVRKLGDIVFASILRSLARPLPFFSRLRASFAVRLYYTGVRAFGGAAHAVMGALALASALLLGGAVAGCAGGCAAPNAWEDPAAPFTLPSATHTNTVTGAHF